MFKKLFRRQEVYVFFFLAALVLVITIGTPSFFSFSSLFELLRNGSVMALLSLGLMIVIISGGIDVSFAAVAMCAQVVSIKLMMKFGWDSMIITFLIAMAIGIGLGAINAALISSFKLPTIVITLGTMILFRGVVNYFLPGSVHSTALPKPLVDMGQGKFLGVSLFSLIFIVLAIFTFIILKYTVAGRGIFAVGGNEKAAKNIGFNVVGIKFFIYCYFGFLAGIAGVIHASINRNIGPWNIIGSELTVIGAVVIGGTSIIGGKGTISGTIFGCFIMIILRRALVLLGIPSYWYQFFVGMTIILVMSGSYYTAKRRNLKNLIFTQ